MKHIVAVVVALGVSALLWRMAGRMSSDALGLALGVVFGVLAGLPTAILVLASGGANVNKGSEVVQGNISQEPQVEADTKGAQGN